MRLIRKTMLESAVHGVRLRHISFTAAMQNIASNWTTVLAMSAMAKTVLLTTILYNPKQARVGDRPDRTKGGEAPPQNAATADDQERSPSWVAGKYAPSSAWNNESHEARREVRQQTRSKHKENIKQ